ncbi:nuclear transport factor 2 family protein [Nocardia sp. NPDC024068]|uniref:nuclear transport factor 2 family protein n=1 Tax=Nocardia sp. NPDC024068 TaxID=3157197 RepID=UPI00340CCA31
MTETGPEPGAPDLRPEVETVHALLAAWLGSAASPQILDAFAAAHHDDFSMVTIDGSVVRKTDLLSGLHRARNSRPGLTITVSAVELLCATADTVVIRFVECQQAGGRREFRRTTAVLLAEDGRYRWLALQETAVDGEQVADSFD